MSGRRGLVSGAAPREDKWYLGGGNRLLWAPPFPVWLQEPGYWDPAHYYNVELSPLFTWTLLDDEGIPIPLVQHSRDWTPARLRSLFRPASARQGIEIFEEKSLLPHDVAACTVTIRNLRRVRRRLHVVFWTGQERTPEGRIVEDVEMLDGAAAFTCRLKPDRRPEIPIGCAFGLDRTPRSWAAQSSEPTALQPHWHLSPFPDLFAGGRLPCSLSLPPSNSRSQLFIALHHRVLLGASGSAAVSAGFAAAGSPAEARDALRSLRGPAPVRRSTLSWESALRQVPRFGCSNPHLTAAWRHRWYGLRLNTQRGGEGNYRHPFVCEGPGYFRAPISYSAPCQMLETRWMHEPELARGILRTFLDHQREDGGLRGFIDVDHHRQEMFYHANWGWGLLGVHVLHPDRSFLDEVYPGLAAYARYFDRERDEEVCGMYDIDNHMETGQEYMSRYMAVDPGADAQHWGSAFRLKGVDVTVYLYELKRVLARVARIIGREDEGALWDIEANRIREAVRSAMWDPDRGMFSDVDPSTGRRTGVKAAVCFYPYFTDIVDESHLPGLEAHLFNPDEFWTPFPIPTTAVDDPSFSAAAHWKGERKLCAWNGRVWPMTNSHIAEAVARSAIRFRHPGLRLRAAEFMSRSIRMMFHEGDPARPNSFEHYHPFTGAPSAYRGIDDYQHSWIADLIASYVCGLRPAEDHLVVDPFPFGLSSAEIAGATVRGRSVGVRIDRTGYAVTVDGRTRVRQRLGRESILDI